MNGLFSFCTNLTSLPDIYKWNINNLTNMNNLFNNCTSLSSLPDISKWNTINVTNMNTLFCGCSSLKSLPYISKWNTNHNISLWEFKNIRFADRIFINCLSLLSLPDISKWNINNLANINNIFGGSSSSLSISDDNTINIDSDNINSSSFLSNIEKSDSNNIDGYKVEDVTFLQEDNSLTLYYDNFYKDL